MKIPLAKLKAMLRFFATFTDPKLLGKTKLMKLFYFVDFGHVKKYAAPITYDCYVHLEHGPVPSTILNLVDAVENDMSESILGDTLSIETRNGSNMKRIATIEQFDQRDKAYFTPSELQIMTEVCSRFKNSTGKNIEDESHRENAWRSTKESENIPYGLAAGDPDCLVEQRDIETILRISE